MLLSISLSQYEIKIFVLLSLRFRETNLTSLRPLQKLDMSSILSVHSVYCAIRLGLAAAYTFNYLSPMCQTVSSTVDDILMKLDGTMLPPSGISKKIKIKTLSG